MLKFRAKQKPYPKNNYQYSSMSLSSSHGPKRVIVFCILTTIIPIVLIILPLYLRHSTFADVIYALAESDVIEIHDGLSSIFCQEHSLKMNTTFNAYQIKKAIPFSSRKHIRLKKSMSLPDDTLEYWGFYLKKGALVQVKACSRFDGSNILLIKGEKILNTCGLLNDYSEKIDPVLADGHDKVSVVLEPRRKINADIHENTKLVKKTRNNNSRIVKPSPNTIIDQINLNYEQNEKEYNATAHRVRRDTEQSGNIGNPHKPKHVLDGGINHGGNAYNYTEKSSNEDVSSFENDLLSCYAGNIYLNQEFPPSKYCNTSFLEDSTMILTTIHEVDEDGYYYYIFYSDNDLKTNDIFAYFDIYKPSIEIKNISESNACENSTACKFNVPFMGEELVVVEIPNVSESEDESKVLLLTSSCQPRMAIYLIFPTAVLFIIVLCAFM